MPEQPVGEGRADAGSGPEAEAGLFPHEMGRERPWEDTAEHPLADAWAGSELGSAASGGQAVYLPEETGYVPEESDYVPGQARRRTGSEHVRRESGGRGRLVGFLHDPAAIVTFLVVVACTVFVFVLMEPSQIFRNTTPSGGDLGAHVWLPAYLKRYLLPHAQIFGWTMDWYAGFPALTYYFPLPMVTIALGSYVVPYNIAFKLVVVAGTLTLPICAWAFGRLSKMSFPGPALLAVAAVAYLFNWDFTIYGGNVASTMAGEFSFSLGLSLAVLFLGLFARGLETGKGRAITAVVLAACGMSHVLCLFFALGGAILLAILRPGRNWVRFLVPVLVVGGLLMAFWALPFELRLPYATNMGYGKETHYISFLFRKNQLWLYILAGLGALLSLVPQDRTADILASRYLPRPGTQGKWGINRIGAFWLVAAVGAGLGFRFVPNSRIWNDRMLPFWFLSLYMLAGIAFVEIGGLVIREVDARRGGDSRLGIAALLPIPVITALAAWIFVGLPLGVLPGSTYQAASNKETWLGFKAVASDAPAWTKWDLSGYQDKGKSSRTAYFDIIDTMRRIGKTYGCGRSMYEYESAINDMGTPDALMLLPFWTHECIPTMEGLYYESSATTPFHFINVSELSEAPSNPMNGIPYASTPNVKLGIAHLRMFGIKYFLAVSPQVKAQANQDPQLKLLAKVGPFATDVTNSSNNSTSVQNQTWNIYEISNPTLVQPLANQPVVMRGVAGGKNAWQDAAVDWYTNPSRWNVYETATGPKSWARVSATDAHPPVTPEPKTTVSDVKMSEEKISFNVTRTGVPVLVKTSYFPNWQVSGAKAVYRSTPNLMVVVPTSKHVTLTYGYTTLDWTGFGGTLLGVVGVGGLTVADVRRRRTDRSRRAQVVG